MTTNDSTRPAAPKPTVRVAVVSPYWTFWEASAGGSALRDDRRELLATAVAAVAESAESAGKTAEGAGAETVGAESADKTTEAVGEPGEAAGASGGALEIVCTGLLDSPDSASALADEVAASDSGGESGSVSGGLDVILVVITMAAPSTHGMAFLDRFPDVPLVVWSVQRSRNIRADFDASDITSAGTAVGTPQLTNMLGRSGRPHEIVVSPLHDAAGRARLGRAIRLAAVAGAVRRARLARVGAPPPGYDCVDDDPQALRAATGVEVVQVSPDDLRRRWNAVGDAAVAQLRRELTAVAEVEVPWDTAAERSLAGAAALAAFDDELNISAGAMNCHVPELRFGSDIGVTPCLGLGRETTRGIPWTCAGDVLTAVAMLVGKRLGGAALYHEVEVIDFDTGEVAIANSGEHDLAWCPAGRRPRLVPNAWYAGDPLTGACLWFELPSGPASLIGFTPHADEPSGYRFVVAEGAIGERSLPRSPTVGGVFGFAGEADVAEAWRAWAAAGVNHHSACSPGHLAADVATVARYLGVGCIQVS